MACPAIRRGQIPELAPTVGTNFWKICLDKNVQFWVVGDKGSAGRLDFKDGALKLWIKHDTRQKSQLIRPEMYSTILSVTEARLQRRDLCRLVHTTVVTLLT